MTDRGEGSRSRSGGSPLVEPDGDKWRSTAKVFGSIAPRSSPVRVLVAPSVVEATTELPANRQVLADVRSPAEETALIRTRTSAVTLLDQSPYRSAQASYQLDMATPIYAQTRRRSAGSVFGNDARRPLLRRAKDVGDRFEFPEQQVGEPLKRRLPQFVLVSAESPDHLIAASAESCESQQTL